MRLLIPGAGNKIFHIKDFQELEDVERVIITDIYPWTYGGKVADSAYLVPRFDDPDFFNAILKIYEKEKFDFLIPIHDYSLFIFSQRRDYLLKMPYKVIMNEKSIVDLISDKMNIYQFFTNNNILTPKTFTFDEFIDNHLDYEFPYYFKPRYINMRGTSKQFYMKIEDKYDLEYIKNKISSNRNSYLIQQFIDGVEVNVDFFCDLGGKLKSVVSLFRQEMGKTRGISRGEIFYDNNIIEITENICEKIKFIGANQIQLFITDDKEYILTEINGRFSGSTVFVKEAGVNYFNYFIKMIKGEPIKIDEKPKLLKMNVWEAPFFYTDFFYKKI